MGFFSDVGHAVSQVTHGISHGNVGEIGSGYGTLLKNEVRVGAGAMTFGTSEIANRALGNRLFGQGQNSYTPTQLAKDDPKLMLAQSGGAPLLTQVALGASVEDALAGYFGRSKGDDWNAYLSQQSPDDQAAINSVRTQLTQIQQNTDLRNQAVQKVVNDFPNVVSMTAPSVIQAKQAAGQEFDDASKQYLDYAMQQTGAKYAAGGNVSSGAMVEAQSRNAASMGMDRLNYQNQQGNQQLDLLGSGWQQQYNEANALRGFQNTMLGQGVLQGFSANQSYLQRQQQTQMQQAGFANDQNILNKQTQNANLGLVGQLGGTAIGMAFGGPAGAAVGGQVGSMGASFLGPQGAMGSGFAGNPRLNLNRGF